MKVKSSKRIGKIIVVLIIIFLAFSTLVMSAISIAHGKVFSQATYAEYNTDKYLTYEDIDKEKYPRVELKIPSGENQLTGFLYGTNKNKGLVIISPGHRDCNDIKLYETTYFVDAGWQVLCYDYTGCFTSKGKNMIGYSQSVHDLDAVLSYVEKEETFENMPVVLFGHSMGAYATAAVLRYDHQVCGAVVASGFDSPVEQWTYSIKRYTGIASSLLGSYAKWYATSKYKEDADLTAVNGINSTNIPVLVISGTDDIFYGGESPIYLKRDLITNTKCVFDLKTTENHNGHYDYFLTDSALEYEKKVDNGKIDSHGIDKQLYMEHDLEIMNEMNSFLEKSIQ